MNFMHNESAEKLRGGYYTPADLAAFLARWVMTSKPKDILEPSCGDGAFLSALATAGTGTTGITAIELDGVEAAKATARAGDLDINAKVLNQDFLSWAIQKMGSGRTRFDAVVGNPPFVRYQYLPETFQAEAEQIFALLDCKFTKHTNAWVPFVLAAVALLRPGGRLAMVVPSEIIHVLHAQSLRTFLAAQCRKIVVVDPEEIWFEDTLQGAVLLMAEKKRDAKEEGLGLGLVPVRGRQFLQGDPEALFNGAATINGRTIATKWTRAFLSLSIRELLDEVESGHQFKRFTDVASVDVGIVTGANKFFLVNDAVIEQYDLQAWAHPMFGRSEHCPGIIYDQTQHASNRNAGLPSNFLWFPDAGVLADPKAKAYIETGEAQDLHTRYKTRIRKNWFTVPSVSASVIGMLKRCHNAPRLILNDVGAYTTDTAYRVQVKDMQPDAFVANFLNPLTALSAELEGRTYGGGVLELVPSEIERLLVPALAQPATPIQTVDTSIRTLSMTAVQETHGISVLEAAGISKTKSKTLLDAWIQLKERRQRIGSATDDE